MRLRACRLPSTARAHIADFMCLRLCAGGAPKHLTYALSHSEAALERTAGYDRGD
eukprot:CAMPEP_0119534548 /NCGR_PEP_ID=MMETSP1344-20130328/47756_1 /TAXON_ID=236787 /ORGANISM="Florenciella parvula, Strain CCMP2471" /LENGTH=54 /DNA_ID=CAMNT_0007575837 /DNA_START=132 /DNA_END=296 /DNA_ORIENTATION=-